jgi:hypothetical protein
MLLIFNEIVYDKILTSRFPDKIELGSLINFFNNMNFQPSQIRIKDLP